MSLTISWETLINELHRLFASDRINIDEVKQVLSSYKSNPADWRKYAMFDPGRYTRNLVDEGNHRFNLMLLCWGEGQSSSIHDHADAHCFMKQLQGSLVESLYEWPKEEADKEHPNKMVSFRDSELKVDEVIYICDEIGLHRVANPSHVQPAVSLHLYSPPFSKCHIFDARTGRKNTSHVTFWSKHGTRCTSVVKTASC